MEIVHVTVPDMLLARDLRVQKQQEMLNSHHCPLVSFTMNIAGAIKLDPAILRAFREGERMILRELARLNAVILDEAETVAPTGCEKLWAVDFDAQALKRRMCRIEESCALGRLFDIDVIASDGAHLSRPSERACLICGQPVRACARSRAHSAEELYQKAQDVIHHHFREKHVRWIGLQAQRALLYEAVTTPKPGLVDCENSGSHTDMDLFSFMDSAAVLRPYFEDCARIADADALQFAGMQAEDEMFLFARANTHQGAIFSLGILCHAAGQCGENADVETILRKAAEVGQIYLNRMTDHPSAHTDQYRRYGLTGARGEAASGFRSVLEAGLPALERALKAGHSLPEAGLHALLCLMAKVHDANIIRRGGMDAQQWVMEQAQNASLSDLRGMNEAFVRRNLSPGGSADLLAVTYFLHFLTHPKE